MTNISTQSEDNLHSAKLPVHQHEYFCQLVAFQFYNQHDRLSAYYGAGYKANGEERAKQALRQIMSRADIRGRISYLRQEQFDIYKPDKEQLRQWYMDIINQAPLTSPTRLKAIQSLAELAELTNKDSGTGNGITLIFNGSEGKSLDIK